LFTVTNRRRLVETGLIAAYAGDLGPSCAYGLFVCQDNANAKPAANQDFKLVPWQAIA
jgi:myo-inositol-hexaphosphate 3-phosphohydrolase